jgi:hypothetical protein
VLAAANIDFELICGAAVMVHVNRIEPFATRTWTSWFIAVTWNA